MRLERFSVTSSWPLLTAVKRNSLATRRFWAILPMSLSWIFLPCNLATTSPEARPPTLSQRVKASPGPNWKMKMTMHRPMSPIITPF